MDFDFITDEKFRAILTRDFDELQKCIECKASKSVLILSGSIIEAVLSDYFINFPPSELDPNQILKMELAKLIEFAYSNNLITQSTKELSTVVRNYRNLIHPGREIRKNEKFDVDSALVAKSLLNIILKEIKENYIIKAGYKAADILSKLENDSISQSLFEKLLNKLHKSEKTKLYNLLMDYGVLSLNHESQLTEPKKYILVLKPHIDREVIVQQLLRLVNKVENGEKWEVMVYYYVLYEDLSYLTNSNIEIIILYVINALSQSTNDTDELNRYVNKGFFSTMGIHLITQEVKSEFLELARNIIVRCHHGSEFIYFSAYDQLVNSLSLEEKEKIKQEILQATSSYFTQKFYDGYSDGDFLPF